MAKTKNIYTRYQEQQANKTIKTDGTESATAMLPPQAKGEKRKYIRKSPHNQRIKEWEHRNKIVTIWLTETEYADLLEMVKTLDYKNTSECIRHSINESITAFKGARTLVESRKGKR